MRLTKRRALATITTRAVALGQPHSRLRPGRNVRTSGPHRQISAAKLLGPHGAGEFPASTIVTARTVIPGDIMAVPKASSSPAKGLDFL